MMYRRLLVPLDGSAFAEHALPLALDLARRAGASVEFVTVHRPFSSMYADSPSPFSDQAEAKVIAEERAYLDRLVKRFATDSTPVGSVLLEGEAAYEIERHAKASAADLIVMTTHGHGPFSRIWLGSVADELVRRATPPILLVRPQGEAIDLNSAPVWRHILIPLDGSALAEEVLAPATTLGNLMQCDYTLIRVFGHRVETGTSEVTLAEQGYSEPTIDQLGAEARKYLDRIAERLRAEGCTVQTLAVRDKYAATAILETAENLGVSVIALETHGRGGLQRLLLGSVADKLIRGSSTPVLVHRSSPK